MEQKVCLVCGKQFDQNTSAGWGLCDVHSAKYEDGYIALVEADPAKSDNPGVGAKLRPEDAYRTGRCLYIKEEAFLRAFNVPSRQVGGKMRPVTFIDPDAFDKLAALAANADSATN